MRPHLHDSETRFPISLRSRLALVGLARRRCPEVQDAWLATRELGQTSSRSTPQGVLRRDPTRRTRSPRHETRRSPKLSLWGMVCSFHISVNRPAPTRMLRVHLVRGGFITAESPRSRKPPEGGEKLERLGVRVPLSIGRRAGQAFAGRRRAAPGPGDGRHPRGPTRRLKDPHR